MGVKIHKEGSIGFKDQLDMGGGEEEGALISEMGNTVISEHEHFHFI